VALRGYKPKTKKALWTQSPSALVEFAALHDRREAAERRAEAKRAGSGYFGEEEGTPF